VIGVGALLIAGVFNVVSLGSKDLSSTPVLAATRNIEAADTSLLDDRRSMVSGDRMYQIGAADGRYPALGTTTRGEMGGFWMPPLKLLDGIWFSADNKWLGPATRSVSGPGFVRSELPGRDGLKATRVDFVPDGLRASLIGMTFSAPTARRLTLTVDAHSELMSAYPTGQSQPSQSQVNLPDSAAYSNKSLVFRDKGSPGNGQPDHDWAAVVAGNLTPSAGRLGSGLRGPQEPPVICPATGAAPKRCDDTDFGEGTGGELKYTLALQARKSVTLWFTVAGSDDGPDNAAAEARKALADPETLFSKKFVSRRDVATRTVVDMPGDRVLERSVEWSKQNIADSIQESRNLTVRDAASGSAAGTSLASARWLAGTFPDRPGLLAGEGDYALYSAVAAGRFDIAQAHLRTLKTVSDTVNNQSGQVIHELASDGSVVSADGDIGDTARFPSAVALLWRWTGNDKIRDELYDFAVRNLKWVADHSDPDGDGWPDGPGMVAASGMGAERIDNAVYTIRGLRDLADLALSKDDGATADWASVRAAQLEAAFDDTWWTETGTQYADSLSNPAGTAVFQRHWTGLVPLEAVLVRSARSDRPLASSAHAQTVLEARQQNCYTSGGGIYATGTGDTTASGGNPGPSCDNAVSNARAVQELRTAGTSVMAVAEGNYGRLAGTEQQRYTTANARAQADPTQWEMPGAMPEIAPGADYGTNIARPFHERAGLLDVSGTYGILWPVVHQRLGISPDMGRDSLSVVPQIPPDQSTISGRNIQVGDSSVDVSASRSGDELTTTVSRQARAALTFGSVVPVGVGVRSVWLDGKSVPYRAEHTSRGIEVVVDLPVGTGRNTLAIKTAS
jgi:hypothetical protein